MDVRELTLAEWERALPAGGFEVFHRPAALEVVGAHAPGELRLFGGFRGDRPVCLLPVVVHRRGFLRFVLSPPPSLGVHHMGPVLITASPKLRKREQTNRTFVEAVSDALGADGARTLVGIACSPDYADPRPYRWAGYVVRSQFMYRLDLRGRSPDAVMQGFHRSLRREIRDARDVGVTVRVGDADDALAVYDAHRARFAERGADYPVPRSYVRDLVAALGEHARVYVAETADGEFVSGITVLYSNDSGFFWQGGVRSDHRGASPNGLLHWRAIEDVLTDPALDSVARYDLGNADMERLSRYKSKFGATPEPYYVVYSGPMMLLAQRVYEAIAY